MFIHKPLLKGRVDGWEFYQGPFPHQLPDGRVIMIIGAYNGQETFNDNAALYVISTDRGETWTKPEIFMASPMANVSHHVMVNLRASPDDGSRQGIKGTQSVLLFWRETFFKGATDDSKTVASIKDYARSIARIFMRRSDDSGRTWSAPRQIDMIGEVSHGKFYYGAHMIPRQLRSGRIILPATYLNDDGYTHTAFFMHSDDEGKTWTKGYDITIPTKRGAMEPTPVETAPDKLYCLFRTRSGFLYEATSTDGGVAWSAPKSSGIPSPESIPQLIKLRNGNYLLVWNNVHSTENYPRYPLTAALSIDECKTWAFKRDIATETGRNQLSNHHVTQLDDGRILLALSHYHATEPKSGDVETVLFDEDWVRGK